MAFDVGNCESLTGNLLCRAIGGVVPQKSHPCGGGTCVPPRCACLVLAVQCLLRLAGVAPAAPACQVRKLPTFLERCILQEQTFEALFMYSQ